MKNTVVLINPPFSLEDRYGKDMKQFGAVTEPLGIAYIAGYLISENIDVRIIDAPAEKMTGDDVVQRILDLNGKIIGISMLTPSFGVVRDLCKKIKEAIKDSLIVLGGPHCTALPERTLQEIPEADITCIGEGEVTMSEIARNNSQLDFNSINGICYRDGEEILRTEKRQYIKELDTIPPPARHLLPMEKYHLTASRVADSSYCPTIIVARGCPFSCTYCSRTFGRTFRAHSVQRIIREIESLISNYHISQVNIEADTLTAKKKFVKELCNALIDSGLNKKIKWTCESRVDTVNEEILKLMRKAGCWQISYGVETGSQRLLDMIKKSETLEQIEETFKITKKTGITIRGFFMLGLPTETQKESLSTINYAIKLDPLWAQFTITIPYPGTEMFDKLDRAGEIRSYNWSNYNTWSGWRGNDDMPFVAEGRSIEELSALQKKALRKFYLRPIVVLRFLSSVTSFHDLKKYITGLMVLIKSRLPH